MAKINRNLKSRKRTSNTIYKHKPDRRIRKKKSKIKKDKFINAFLLILNKVLLLWLGLFSVMFILGSIYFLSGLPSISKIHNIGNMSSVTIVAQHKDSDIILSTYGKKQGNFIDYKSMPAYFTNALISVEDKRFFNHNGFDFFGILRAGIVNYMSNSIKQGGSTITQQLAKNIFLNNERSIKRKVQELILAFWLEMKYSKDDIINMYINHVYWGSGIYGIDAATRFYFNKVPSEITLSEVALLVGMLKAPSYYAPNNYPERAKKRALVVLNIMRNNGYVTDDEIGNIKSVTVTPAGRGSLRNRYFADWILQEKDKLNIDSTKNSTIYATLDYDIQLKAEKILNATISKYGDKHNITQGALLLMENSGKVIAMVGGKKYSTSNFNRATTALRQAGSLFKLFVYAAALEQGYDLDHILIDEKIKFGNWSPKNYGDKYYDRVTLRFSFAKSLNSATIRLAKDIGIEKIIKSARLMGITTNINRDLSIALGTSDVTLLQITSAYACIANNGYKVKPYGISKILQDNKKLLYQHTKKNEKVLPDQLTNKIRTLLSDVVKYGTASRFIDGSLVIGGKTGTTQYSRDAWFVGFNDRYTMTVWLGNDDNKHMKHVYGGTIPVLIWNKVMKLAYYKRSKSDAVKKQVQKPIMNIKNKDEENLLNSILKKLLN